MADVEGTAAAFVENENAKPESSQDTQVVDDQAAAPSTPFEALQSRLHDHPHDTVAWQDLINVAEDSGDLKLISTAYDSLLKVYPNTVSPQVPDPKMCRENANSLLNMWCLFFSSWICISTFCPYMLDSNVCLTCAPILLIGPSPNCLSETLSTCLPCWKGEVTGPRANPNPSSLVFPMAETVA